jgi:hypothetical protein
MNSQPSKIIAPTIKRGMKVPDWRGAAGALIGGAAVPMVVVAFIGLLSPTREMLFDR